MKTMFRILLPGLVFGLWPLLFLPRAVSAEIELSSNQPIVFEGVGDDVRLIARGEAELRHGGSMLTANEIIYRRAEGWASASGNVIISSPAIRATADEVTFHIAENRLAAHNVRFGSPPLFGHAREMRLSGDLLEFDSSTFHWGEPTPFALNLRARSATHSPDERVTARGVAMRVGSVPVFYLPLVNRRTDSMRTEFSTDAGISKNLGTHANLDTRTPVWPGFAPGLETGYYSRRGFLFGPGADYAWESPDHRLEGVFHSGYIRDQGGERWLGSDRLDRPIDRSRGYAEWRHRQHWNEQFGLTGVVNLWSDSEVTRDFRPRLFQDNQYPDNFLEGVHLGKGHMVSFFTRFEPNDFGLVNERLPEVRFDLFPKEDPAGIYHSFHAGAAVLRQNDPLEADRARSDRADFYYNLKRPVRLNDWLAFTPTLGGRMTHYNRALERSSHTRFLGEVGADVEMNAHAVRDYRNELWGIDGIRHVVKPLLQYRFIPKAEQGRAHIPEIDRQVFSTNLPPLGLGEIRNIDQMDEIHTLRYGIDNLWQTRHPDYGSRDLFSLFLANDLRFSRKPGENLVSDIHAETHLTPVSWFRFDAYGRVSPQEPKMREFYSGITLQNANAWSLRLGNEYLENNFEQYSVFYRLRLNEVYTVGADLRYDADLRRVTRQSYSVMQNIHQTWQVEYQVVFRSGAEREASTGFGISLTYTAF